MRFGVLLDHQYAKGEPLAPRIGELVEQTQTARDLGFDSVFGIHHYLGSLQTLQPLSLMSRLIDHSGAMQIGTGILILPLGHPVHWAEEIASIDQLSGGRFVLGIGSGYRDDEFDSFGLRRSQRTRRMVESLRVMEQLWTGERVTHHGDHFQIDGQVCSVLPVRGTVPVWIGANSPAGIERAARLGHSWLAPGNVKRNWAVGNLQGHKRALQEAGFATEGRTYPLHRDLFVADSREEAMAFADTFPKAAYAEYVQYGMDYFETLWDELKEKALFFGTADDVVARIEDFAAAGFNHFVFRVQWLGCPHETSMAILERFAREVLPRVRANVEVEVEAA